MLNSCTFRKGKADELEMLQAIFVTSIQTTCKKDYTAVQIEVWIDSVQNRDRWVQKLTCDYFLVAEMQKGIVGFASLQSNNYLDFLYVHPDFQSRGIGRKLIQLMEMEAIRLGSGHISSDVSVTALSTFLKCGYLVIKPNFCSRSKNCQRSMK